MTNISRRTFLKGTAAGIAYAALPSIALPASSSAPLAEVFRPPGENIFAGEFIVNPEGRWIRYVGKTMFTARDLYSKLKDYWRDSAVLIKYPFPLVAITPDYFIFQEGFYLEESSYVWMNRGCLFDEARETKWAAVVGLGAHDAPVTVIQNGRLEATEKVDPWKHVLKLTPDINEIRWYANGYELDVSAKSWTHKKTIQAFSSREHLGFDNIYKVSGAIYYPAFYDQTPPL